MDESWRTYGWVMAHVWMSHVSHVTRTYEWVIRVTSQVSESYVARMTESRHTHQSVTSHVCMNHVCHVTHINESRRTYEWVTLHVWMSHVIRMNESYESRHRYQKLCRTYDSVTSHASERHVARMYESCESRYTHQRVTSHIWMSHTSYGIRVLGWLQLVASIKLQVSFAKETYKRDYILQKRPMNESYKSRHTYPGVASVSSIDKIIGLFCL